MRLYKRIFLEVKPRRFSDAVRHSIQARGLQLPGPSPSGPARHSILRSIPGVERSAHDAVLDPNKSGARRTVDNQCPGQVLGIGSNPVRPQNLAVRPEGLVAIVAG